MATRYFLYSTEQFNLRKSVEEKMGKRFKVGHVIVDGVRKPFTEISASPISKYADAKVVASGDIATMRYTEPEGV